MFYVDSLSADTVIEWGIDAMLRQVDPLPCIIRKKEWMS